MIHEESTGGFCAREATQFPQGINLAATWDPELVERVAAVIGRQLRAVGARLTLAPVLDIARDARWGRLEETYGEDPELASRMGVAYVRGVQAQGVVATAKHFLGYGAPDGGFNWGWSSMGPRHLRDVIAAPFRAVINEAGVGAVMPSYNEIDGLPLHGSRELLTELLREELGFTGVTVADYFGVSSLEDFHHCANDEADSGQARAARRTRYGAPFLLVLSPSPCARERRRRPGRSGRCFLSPRAGTKGRARPLRAAIRRGGLGGSPVRHAGGPSVGKASRRGLHRASHQRWHPAPPNAGARVAVLGPSAR